MSDYIHSAVLELVEHQLIHCHKPWIQTLEMFRSAIKGSIIEVVVRRARSAVEYATLGCRFVFVAQQTQSSMLLAVKASESASHYWSRDPEHTRTLCNAVRGPGVYAVKRPDHVLVRINADLVDRRVDRALYEQYTKTASAVLRSLVAAGMSEAKS